MKLPASLFLAGLVLTTLPGCAPVIVGGAATAGAAIHSRQTIGSFIDDEGIEMKSNIALHQVDALRNQCHISIASYNGIVLMVGQAPTEALRQQAEQIVTGIEKVRQVHDEITIAAPNSYITRSSDALITAKVKASLFNITNIDGFDPTRVKVVTEDGIVYLMGMVYRNEADAVVAQVRQVGGVEKVVKLFEYLD